MQLNWLIIDSEQIYYIILLVQHVYNIPITWHIVKDKKNFSLMIVSLSVCLSRKFWIVD